MQTFLPYKDFQYSAECLDWRRLGKQRVECLQIYKALRKKDYGWQNHPAVKMWRGYEKALLKYAVTIIKEWRRRGYNDTMLPKMRKLLQMEHEASGTKHIKFPEWLGDKSIHSSHRACLLKKDYDHYSQYNWDEAPAIKEPNKPWPYVWPVAA